MPAYIQQISTSVPANCYSQDELCEKMKELVATTELQKRVIHRIYSRSGIITRHSVLEDLHNGGIQELNFNGHGISPGTAVRNTIYEHKGRELFIGTAKKLLVNGNVSPDDITHLITISCTGFYSPGPDYDIIKNLGLDPNTERYNLGFMGCYAAIPGLKLAARICKANPEATVMVVSNELCSLHFQGGASTDQLLSASVFADGAAGALVTAKKPGSGNYFQIKDFTSTITETGAGEMTWTIGDTGFNMVLSTYITEILSKNLDGFLKTLLNRFGLSQRQIDCWAIHPGGRAILDRIEQQFDIPYEKLSHSRKVLSQYGNMSSATILFVLKEILDKEEPVTFRQHVLAMAFGPGLTLESGLFVKNAG